MDLKRPGDLVTVADPRHRLPAALRLRISQSALSRQIQVISNTNVFQLDCIGCRLFHHQRRAGLLGDCRGVLGQLGSLLANA